MNSLRDWLASIGLDQYAEVFEHNDLELDVLGELSDLELKELGVSLGHRKRLQKSLRELGLLSRHVAPEQLDEPAPAPQAERRNVTVMFCDLVGSTALADGMDPEAFRDLLSVYHEAAREPIHRYGGHIARYLGDGMLVFYGFPRAREDDAVRAVRSALEVVRAIEVLANNNLQVRLGLATGIVVAGDIVGADRYEDQTVLGDVPNLAARLQSSAAPNTVLIAKSTCDLVKDTVNMEELPPLSLKGIAAPVAAYRVLGLSDTANQGSRARSRRLSSIVGREGELALIDSRWDRVRRGSGQAVLIAAEAGVGKSRLVRQVRENVKDQPRAVIAFYCSPYQSGTPFFPIAVVASRGAGISPQDSDQQVTEKLHRWLEMLGYAPKDGVALLGSILGVASHEALPTNPEEHRRRTLNFLSEVIVHLAQRDTSLIVFEDLHFADSSTIELITLVIHRLDQTPALLLLTFRPSFDAPWKALPHATLIALNPLARDEARRLVKAIAGERHLLPETEDEIIARCDGVPLFVEELTKTVIETIDQADNRIAIPMTLRDTLAARLDALGRAKQVAQAASIIGREFSYRVLESLVPEYDDLAEDLERLESAELITRRGEPPEARYLFKHALVQEAAYESLLLSDRRSRHLSIGEQLSQRTVELSATPGLIALHFERGGAFDRALEYRQIAGTKAAKANAFVEAEEHFTKALENLSSLTGSDDQGDRRAELLLLLGAVQMPLYGFPSRQVHETYSGCYDLLRSSSDLSKRFDATWGLWLNRCIAGQLDQARRLTRELESVAHTSGDRGNELQAHHAGWTNVAITGELSEAFAHINAGLKLYSLSEFGDHCFKYGGHDPGICARAHGALFAWQLGFPDKAKDHCLKGIELAKSLRHPTSSGVATSFGALFYQYVGNPRAILDFDAEAMPAPAHMKMIMQALKGWAMVRLGETTEGLRVSREGVETYRDLGATARLSYMNYLLADAYLYTGAHEEALAEIEPACAQKSDITTISERLRLKGEILRCLGEPEQAEQLYNDALTIAQKQGARGWQLRTAISISQLWHDQGRRGEAIELLAPIYEGFNEGFDTPDLKRAKALLDQLAAK